MYDLTFSKDRDILHVIAVGTRTFETVLSIAMDILNECKKQQTSKVLIDVQQLSGRLKTLDAYEIPTKYFPEFKRLKIINKAAIVDLKEFENSYQFFENVATNRGYNLRIFGDTEAAIEWLR